MKGEVMKWMIMAVFVFLFAGVQGQEAGEELISILPDGRVEVVGTDFFGAEVIVLYNSNGLRAYQQRTLDGEITFAHYDDGVLREYGSYNIDDKDKPLLVEY
jgi:hypothetical protein